MVKKENNAYVHEAIQSFRNIMSKQHRGIMDSIIREQKGEFFVLHFLSKRDNYVLPSELSAALESSPARISALLGTLEKKGDIVRDIDTNNRRNILVSITDTGIQRITAAMEKWSNILENVFTEMGEEDAKEYLRLSEKFNDIMQKHSIMSTEK